MATRPPSPAGTEPAVPLDPSPAGTREVVVGDGVAWLEQAELTATRAVVTSLPDVSEMGALGFEGWRTWFVDVAARICSRVAEGAVAVFYQSDVRREGRWVDKGFLVAQGAERAGAACLFHRVVCRAPAGTRSSGRPAYSHLQAFSRGLRLPTGDPDVDVLPRMGETPWARGTGTEACEAVCRFLLRATPCRVVVDPFCGMGTILAVANAHGLDAIGVELSPRRAERARALRYLPGIGLR